MDPALTALISAVLGGAVTASGGWVRQRYGARTAARLVYAELTRNTAPILYYRRTGVWPTSPTVDTAWTESSKDLARSGHADAFDTMYRGYAALPALDYVLADAELPAEVRDALVDSAVDDIVAALQTAGRIAQIRDEKIEDRVERMRRGFVSVTDGVADPILRRAAGVIPPALLEEIAQRGSSDEREWAESTIASSPGSSTWLKADTTSAIWLSPIRRAVLDAHRGEDVQAATLARGEGDVPTGDDAVDEVYDALGTTAGFYQDIFDYSFADSDERTVTAVVHYGTEFANCFWDGSRLIVGDGDGKVFNRFSSAPEVIAHELSHDVMTATGLVYNGQSGAMFESLCDVFGVLSKQYSLHQTSAAEAGWLVGEGLLVNGGAIRSMADPGTAYDDPVLGRDSQPAHFDDYVADSGGFSSPLINCGIPNRAFYLAATALPGPAWQSAGQIWYAAAMSGRLRPNSGFAAFAGLTIAECRERFGDDGPELDAVRNAWRTVGVKPRAPTKPAVRSSGAGA